MKKIAVILAALAAVAVILFVWLRGQIGVLNPALLVPANTVAYASLPDLPRTVLRWPKTTLAQIGAEPEVRAFLEKPLAALAGRTEKKEAEGLLIGLKPLRIFAAATKTPDGRIAPIIGFQFFGGKADFDKAVARLRQQIYGGKIPEAVKESLDGVEVTSTKSPNGETIYSAETARWGFLTNSRDALADALARARSKGASPALEADAEFQKCLAQLPSDPDFVGFFRPAPLVDALVAFGEMFGAAADPSQVAPLKQAAAVGTAFKLDGADLRDAIFVLRPGAPDAGALQHLGMDLTGPDTLAYFNVLVPPARIAALASSALMEPALARNPGLGDILKGATKVVGNEVALSIGWPKTGMLPETVAAVALSDRAGAEELMIQAGGLLPEITVSESGGVKFYGFPSLRSPFVDPTLAIADNMAVMGISPAAVASALTRAATPAPLSSAPAFTPALDAYRSANEAFGFIDLKEVFSRGFPMLRGVISFGVSLVPGASDVVDATKLPQTETIAKHLTPLVFSESRLDDGYLIESSGPITMNQAAILFGGGATNLLAPRLHH